MSTTTGNVKISELDELSAINDGAKLKIPVSNNNSDTSNPNWTSYSVSASVLSNFMNSSLGISSIESNMIGLQENYTDLSSYLLELKKHLGYYSSVNTLTLTRNYGKFISINGEVISGDSNFWISNKVSLKQGNFYLFLLSGPGIALSTRDLSFISKVHEREYVDSTGATHSETTYEPLPHHYQSMSDGPGYGRPSSNYLVFLATEDMDVVFSAHGSESNNSLLEVKYGAFIQIADNLLSINGEMMKVIVEAITKNRKDIESLYEKTRSLGDIHVTSIDSDEYPSVQGEPMVVVKNRAPGEETATHGADVPNRIGQIWVNTTNGIAYIAVALGLEGWKQITV